MESIRVEALRMAEGSIFVHIKAPLGNSRSKLIETHEVSGNIILVTLVERPPEGIGTQITGTGEVQFKVWGNTANISTIAYVDSTYQGKTIRTAIT